MKLHAVLLVWTPRTGCCPGVKFVAKQKNQRCEVLDESCVHTLVLTRTPTCMQYLCNTKYNYYISTPLSALSIGWVAKSCPKVGS